MILSKAGRTDYIAHGHSKLYTLCLDPLFHSSASRVTQRRRNTAYAPGYINSAYLAWRKTYYRIPPIVEWPR
jgi:hypothetical protein